jgi:hypothetical protein
MTKVKALYVLQCRDFIIERHGDAGIEVIKQHVSPAAREVLYSPLLVASDWVEVAHALEQALGYDRAFGTGVSGQAAERMMRDLVAKHYNSMYRSVFAQAESPVAVLDKSSRLWRRFYDSGDSQLTTQTPTSVVKRITGCDDFPIRHELLMLPYYEELLRQWGARDPMARHTKCVARGAECCETTISWRRVSSAENRGVPSRAPERG